MKTIVVCLDGTNQTKKQPHPTNISMIFDALGGAPVDADHGSFETDVAAPANVKGKYLPGVGTEGDLALKVLGNLFGDGIAEPIVRGYTFLSRTYQPGDAIVITGFSRGATAARALAGFVTGQGLLDTRKYDVNDKSVAYLRAIAAWYHYRHEAPNLANQLRLGLIQGLFAHGVPTLGDADFAAKPKIKAVAVFDTVSSLGVPHLDDHGDAAFDFSICNTNLSDLVENGFHALAADEMRDLFGPTFWAARDGVTQQIFPGTHSDVGGGYPNRGLSDAALDWMLSNLETLGVPLDRAHLGAGFAPDPLAIAQDDGASFPFNRTPRRARAFPDKAVLSQSLLKRWDQPAEMLPGTQKAPYRAKGTYSDGRALK